MKKCPKCQNETRSKTEKYCKRCGHTFDEPDDFFRPKTGSVGMDYSGSLGIGIGSGMSIDLDDGGLNIGGISLDGD